ncbi:MAG: molybdenum cofactor biosynthesis protein MoaE [Xanthomonadales bacterium]|nr:molybdenum cofactor biosynthesis protein MoaE [Xanthomonadales bacterium]
MSFSVASAPIDLHRFRQSLEDHRCGGVVFFEGRVRDHNEGRGVERLEYEVYHPLARSEGERVMDEARQRWAFHRAACVHREGMLELGDMAVIVGVASAHRDEAFQAARYIIDEIKVRLPIWKREHYLDGERSWVNCERCAQHGHHHSHG